MASLKEVFATQVDVMRDQYKSLVKEHGDRQIGTVTVKQLYGGLRGVRALVCDTSQVPQDQGLIIRGKPVADLVDWLPEDVFFLLLTGQEPDVDARRRLQEDMRARSTVPRYVWQVLEAMPSNAHPMAMLTTALNTMASDSHFRRRYEDGMPKDRYWEPALEDSLDIIARLPAVAAYIYRLRFDKGPRIKGNPDLDIGANFAHLLGMDDERGVMRKLMRMYLVLHTDHGAGNVSAFTTFTVSSALSDPYLALAAGLNGLAGPLHGLANQECLHWVLGLMDKFGGVPTHEQVTAYAQETLDRGEVVPGYGHAVLRVEDPRFTAFLNFGKAHCPNDPVFKTMQVVYEAVPKVLGAIEKISNPWPNVDAASGSLLYHFGLREFTYYTVLFSIARAMGVLAQLVIARATGAPIMRPADISTDALRAELGL